MWAWPNRRRPVSLWGVSAIGNWSMLRPTPDCYVMADSFVPPRLRRRVSEEARRVFREGFEGVAGRGSER
eukprot:15330433-Alexandrium_andersonii.AAC.1